MPSQYDILNTKKVFHHFSFENKKIERLEDGSYRVKVDDVRPDYTGISIFFPTLDWEGYKQSLKITRNHSSVPIAFFKELTVESDGVYGVVKFLDTAEGKLAEQEFLDGVLQGFSIEVLPKNGYYFPEDSQEETIILPNGELLTLSRESEPFNKTQYLVTEGVVSGYSLVNDPANPYAVIRDKVSSEKYISNLNKIEDLELLSKYSHLEDLSEIFEVMSKTEITRAKEKASMSRDKETKKVRIVDWTPPIRLVINSIRDAASSEIEEDGKKKRKIDYEKYASFFAGKRPGKKEDDKTAYIGPHHAIIDGEEVVPKYLLTIALDDVLNNLLLAKKAGRDTTPYLEAYKHLKSHFDEIGIDLPDDEEEIHSKFSSGELKVYKLSESTKENSEENLSEEKNEDLIEIKEKIAELTEKFEESLLTLDYLKRAAILNIGEEAEEEKEREDKEQEEKEKEEVENINEKEDGESEEVEDLESLIEDLDQIFEGENKNA